MTPLAELGRAMLAAAIDEVAPSRLVSRVHFDAQGISFKEASLRPAGRLIVVSVGKAAPGLADEVLRRSVRTPDTVFVLAPDGLRVPDTVAQFTRLASHPLPDERGEEASRELVDLLAGLTPDDGVLLLLSGGASALLSLPLEGMGRDSVADVTSSMLAAGAPIHELNCLRKHLLRVAGGRLAVVTPAYMLTLALSDVPGDDLATIGSGPSVGDPTTFSRAIEILARRGLAARFPAVERFLEAGARGEVPESPKPGDPRLARSHARVLGSSRDALTAAASVARHGELTTATLTRRLHGEARHVGEALASLTLAVACGAPAALLAAGETTVTVTGSGRGGRNLELALGAARALQESSGCCLVAAATDGVDGSSPAAGAVVDGNTLFRARALGRDARDALARNDSWGFFRGLPEVIVTGPTGTNVADLAFVLVAGSPTAFLADTAGRAATPWRSPASASRPPHPNGFGRLPR